MSRVTFSICLDSLTYIIMKIKNLFAAPVVASLLMLALPASAQVYTTTAATPTLAVELLSTGLTANPSAGTTGATMAIVRLDTTYSPDAIRLASLPLIVSTANGATPASLTNCRVYNEASPTAALNNGSNVPGNLVSGLNVVNLDTPLVIQRGSVVLLDVKCDIAAGAVTGGTFQFSLNTANVVATGNTTGLPAAVYVGVSTPGGVPSTGGVGLPNTGAGGDAGMNLALILGSLVAASLGVLYARKAVR